MRIKKIILILLLCAGVVFLGCMRVQNVLSPIIPNTKCIKVDLNLKPFNFSITGKKYKFYINGKAFKKSFDNIDKFTKDCFKKLKQNFSSKT